MDPNEKFAWHRDKETSQSLASKKLVMLAADAVTKCGNKVSASLSRENGNEVVTKIRPSITIGGLGKMRCWISATSALGFFINIQIWNETT